MYFERLEYFLQCVPKNQQMIVLPKMIKKAKDLYLISPASLQQGSFPLLLEFKTQG